MTALALKKGGTYCSMSETCAVKECYHKKGRHKLRVSCRPMSCVHSDETTVHCIVHEEPGSRMFSSLLNRADHAQFTE